MFRVGVLIALLVAVGSPRRAEAFGTIGERLVCACTQDDTVCKELKQAALSSCGLAWGPKNICQILSGSPFTCNEKVGPTAQADDLCYYHSVKIKLTGQLAPPAGWTINADADAEMLVSSTKTGRQTCGVNPRVPEPTGNAGSFVSEIASLEIVVRFKIDGTLTINPGGFKVTGEGLCISKQQEDVWAKQTTTACNGET